MRNQLADKKINQELYIEKLTALIKKVKESKTSVQLLSFNSYHTIIVNNTIACTLGHGFKGPVIEHDFYGTEKVHDSLKKFPSYSSGVVHLSNDNIVRSNETGCACDYMVSISSVIN